LVLKNFVYYKCIVYNKTIRYSKNKTFMIPTNSSGTTNGCDNISSNCVVWQGPDIACINLCSGDTISEVVFKLATEVCNLITNGVIANPNLTGLDLTCLNIPGVTPTTLVPVLQAMVVQICANSTSPTQKSTELPMMTLPACLQYNDSSGNPVTELRLDLFATLIANQVCTNLTSINVINTTLTSYNTRLNVLEACVLPCSGGVVEAQIVPTCVSNIGTLTNVSVVVLALESAFCALRTAVGLPAAINSAISQSIITGSYTQLSNSSASYSGIVGWNNSASTLAQSVQNAWVVIDDMYTAITNIQTNCCPGGCDGITFSYSTSNTINGGTGLITDIVFNFITSSIPSTFNDSAGFSQITITDSNGASTNQVVSVSSLQNNTTGVSINVASLNVAQQLNATLQFSVTDGNDTCTATQTSVIAAVLPCPILTLTSITSTGLTIGFTNVLGTSATFLIEIVNSSNVVVATATLTNQGSTVSQAFTGLIAGTTYNIRNTVSLNGGTEICALVPFETVVADVPCANGMDVAFVMDYSGSMTGSITALQTGFASTINTIVTSSGGNNYRLSVVTADEATGGTVIPNYNACTEYTSLPAAQRLNYPGNNNHQLFLTAWEMFGTNNQTSATTQLNLLGEPASGATCVQMGSGGSTGPECTDQAISRVLNNNLTGAFRANVAKYIIVGTDNLPGGDDGIFNANDWTFIQTMATQALTQGVKIFILGPGVDSTYQIPGGALVYPWRYLATTTAGSYNNTFATATINSQIVAACS
jgi:hypothetical protein